MINSLISQDISHSTLASQQCKVLVVDDDEISAILITNILSPFADVEYLCESQDAIAKCTSFKPDLIILDVNMPVISGLELCREIKNDPAIAHIPVMFATASIEHETQKACWEAGGADFIVKPILAMTLIHRAKNLLMNELRVQFLRDISFRDSLTGLCNRHYLNTEVVNTLKSTARECGSFGVIVLDIDFFKGYNDRYGHIAGDHCLRDVAHAIVKAIHRPSDMAVRFGGEEFIVLLPKTDRRGVELVTKRIVGAIEALGIQHAGSEKGVVTISAGYSVIKPSQQTKLDDLINQADLALFDAKESGRNTFKAG